MTNYKKRALDLGLSKTTSVLLQGLEEQETLERRNRPKKRRREAKEVAEAVPYDKLNENWQYMFDTEDILEDYLTGKKLKDLRPLVLDTLSSEWAEIGAYTFDGTVFQKGESVKLSNGTFLRIHSILEGYDDGPVVLRGHRLARSSCLKPILSDGQESDSQELFLNIEAMKKSTNQLSFVDIPIHWVEGIVIIHLTNRQRSSINETSFDEYYCRWKLTRSYEDIGGVRKATNVAIERIRFGEADEGYEVEDDIIRLNWREETVPGGSDDGHYTALDGFCCSGGWSRGASMAGGIKIVRSFDNNQQACQSYRMNFPKTNCLNLDVFDYCNLTNMSQQTIIESTSPRYVDIAHYSTPCQVFSPAHTRPGPNDERNFAASFCLSELLKKDRPRVITFENTNGLERRHFDKLKAVFGQVTSMGYSLRFGSLNLADFGLPQNRRRLIMVASCPGEPLPTFPTAMYSKDGQVDGTKPWRTILDSLKHIPWDGFQNHQPSLMKKRTPPANAKSVAATITCAGGKEQVHPEGRQYTIMETQLMQGFPIHHRFAMGLGRNAIGAQIGNAFPASFVKQLLRHIRKQMQSSDGVAISVDQDEFLSEEEIAQQQVDQFFSDHEQLPCGTRANVGFVDEDEAKALALIEEEDDDEPVREQGEEQDWSWIVDAINERRESAQSFTSDSSQSAISTLRPDNRPDSARSRAVTPTSRPGSSSSMIAEGLTPDPPIRTSIYDGLNAASDAVAMESTRRSLSAFGQSDSPFVQSRRTSTILPLRTASISGRFPLTPFSTRGSRSYSFIDLCGGLSNQSPSAGCASGRSKEDPIQL